jgi:tetratricopeptide (TPR) repeat protein
MPIEPPDAFHLAAAVGWLELGNATEALVEIAKIHPGLTDLPEVLEVRWQISAALPNWEEALQVAEKMVALNPEKDIGWLHRAYALRRTKTGGLDKAREALRPAFDRFPKTWLIPYNLACYAAQLGFLDEAWDWLNKAVAMGQLNRVKDMALHDSDLDALRDRIRKL